MTWTAGMLEITDLLADFRSMGREEYLSHHPYPVLLHQTNRGDAEADTGFVTGVKKARRRATVLSENPKVELQTARTETGLLVFPVRPLVEAIGDIEVTVGRDTSADVQLPYDKVSSHHGTLRQRGGDPRWYVQDNQATNGTFVDGAILEPGTEVEVRSGQQIKFGTAALVFHLAEDFYAYLTQLQTMGRRPHS